MRGKFLISTIGAAAVALFAAAAIAAPGHLDRTPPGPGLITNVGHMGGHVGGMHMGSMGHSTHIGSMGRMHGPMIGSRHVMHAYSAHSMGHHHHHHRRFFVVGFPYYDYYYDDQNCWWSKRRHHWVCSY